MAKLLKHVGKFGEKPCVVVFRELPGEQDYCLIVQTDNLESRQHDDLMNVVQSLEAQEANDISEVLFRRQFTDGSNMLNSLHYGKKLQKVPVGLVYLTPAPNQSLPLEQVNAEIRKLKGGYTPPVNDEAHLKDTTNKSPTSEDTVESSGEAVASTEDEGVANIAKNLLTQATLMEEDATALLKEAETKKQEAFRLDPSLRPPGRPKKIR
jgi:hypothetical protein